MHRMPIEKQLECKGKRKGQLAARAGWTGSQESENEEDFDSHFNDQDLSMNPDWKQTFRSGKK